MRPLPRSASIETEFIGSSRFHAPHTGMKRARQKTPPGGLALSRPRHIAAPSTSRAARGSTGDRSNGLSRSTGAGSRCNGCPGSEPHRARDLVGMRPCDGSQLLRRIPHPRWSRCASLPFAPRSRSQERLHRSLQGPSGRADRDGAATVSNVIVADFQEHAEACYRRGYALLLRLLAGERLPPDEHARAICASFTHQRRVQAAYVQVSDGHPSEWEAWNDGYT